MSNIPDEETSFDDVAMSLLLFFLVMTMVSSSAGLSLLKQRTTVPPQSSKKSKKIFGPHDVSIHIEASRDIRVRAIGGKVSRMPAASFAVAADAESETTAAADPAAPLPFTETSEAAVELKEKLVSYVAPLRKRMLDEKKPARIYLTAHPDAPLGVVHAIRYGVYMTNKELGAALAMKLLPCPPLRRGTTIDKVVDFNRCMAKSGKVAKCEAKVKMKKAKLKKRFCGLSRLMQS